MALINVRWPADLAPETCDFGRTRNDVLQRSPISRVPSTIRQGRPLWTAKLTWSLPQGQKLAKLRYYLEALDGFNGSVQIWDFTQPFPWGLTAAPLAAPTNLGVFWSYLGANAAWNFAGLPSPWQIGTTVPLAASAAIGATDLEFSGLDPNSLLCVQGQYVQVGRRLYVAAETVEVDSSGDATVPILNGLISAAASGDDVRFSEAACEMQLADQNFDISGRAGDGLVSASATFIETVTDFE